MLLVALAIAIWFESHAESYPGNPFTNIAQIFQRRDSPTADSRDENSMFSQRSSQPPFVKVYTIRAGSRGPQNNLPPWYNSNSNFRQMQLGSPSFRITTVIPGFGGSYGNDQPWGASRVRNSYPTITRQISRGGPINDVEYLNKMMGRIKEELASQLPNVEHTSSGVFGTSPIFRRSSSGRHTYNDEGTPGRLQSPFEVSQTDPWSSWANPASNTEQGFPQHESAGRYATPPRSSSSRWGSTYSDPLPQGVEGDTPPQRNRPFPQYEPTADTVGGSDNTHRPSGENAAPPQGAANLKGPTPVSMPRNKPPNRPPPIERNPPHLFQPAHMVHPIYHEAEDEDPDKWVTPEDSPRPLPDSVILSMNYDSTVSMLFGWMTFGTARSGEPDQRLKVLFDTGSSNLWLLSTTSCSKQRCYPGANVFNPSLSTTYKPTGQTITHTYGTGQVTGVFAEDTVSMGDEHEKILLKNLPIGEAHSFIGILQGFDAICGMGLTAPAIMGEDPPSFLYTMTKQYGTTLPFGFYINMYNPEKSKLIFGSGYQQLIEGELHTHYVVKAKFFHIGEFYKGWYIKMDGWIVEAPGAKPIEIPTPPDVLAYVDSGSTAINGPSNVMNKLNEQIFQFAKFQVYDDYTYPCSVSPATVYDQLPDVSIVIDGIKYSLPPYIYIARMADGCRTLFRGLDRLDKVIIGNTFMSKYFTRFDHSKKTVQFALSKQDLSSPKARPHIMMEQRRWG